MLKIDRLNLNQYFDILHDILLNMNKIYSIVDFNMAPIAIMRNSDIGKYNQLRCIAPGASASCYLTFKKQCISIQICHASNNTRPWLNPLLLHKTMRFLNNYMPPYWIYKLRCYNGNCHDINWFHKSNWYILITYYSK